MSLKQHIAIEFGRTRTKTLIPFASRIRVLVCQQSSWAAALKTITCVAAVLFASNEARAQSISTGFSGSNSNSGAFFDVTVSERTLIVNALEIDMQNSGVTYPLSVYIKEGTYSGSTNNAALWTLASQNTVTGSGSHNPVFVDVTDFRLNADTTYGMFLTLGALDQINRMHYRDGNTTVTNADLQLSLGAGTGGVFNNLIGGRIWNGTIHYALAPSAVPEPSTFALAILGLLPLGMIRRRRHR